MENQINELISILQHEARIYGSILNMSRDKTQVIVENKVNELENIVKLEHSLVSQIGRLENARVKLVEEIAERLGLDKKDITVSDIVRKLEGNLSAELDNARKNTIEIMNELKNVNELNSKLIKNSIDYINFSINLFAETSTVNNTYGNNGQLGEMKKRNLFDKKL